VTPFTSRLPRQPQPSRWGQLNAIVSAAQQGLADGLLHPVIIMSAIAFALGGSNGQLAAFAIIAGACWAIGRVLMNPLLVLIGSSTPVHVAGIILRLGAALLMGLVATQLDDANPGNALDALIVCYAAYELGSMLTTFAQQDPLTRPWSRAQTITATVATLIAGLVAAQVFANDGLSLDQAIRYVILLAMLAVIAGTWFALQMPTRPRQDIGDHALVSVSGMLRAVSIPVVRRYLSYRVLIGIATLADPFLLAYGIRELGEGLRLAGMSLLAYAIAQIIGTTVFPRWVATRGTARHFQIAAFLRLIALVVIIGMPSVATSEAYRERFDDTTPVAWLIAIAVGLIGFERRLQQHVNERYLGDMTSANVPFAAESLANTVIGVLAFTPLIGASLIARYSDEAAITVAAVVAFIAMLVSAVLVETRAHVSTRLNPWGEGGRRVQREA